MKSKMRISQELSENEIWNLFISDGNEDALSRIYSNNYDLLYDYGYRFTKNVHIVEDAIQEVFINLIKYRKSIGFVKNLQGYLVCTFRRQLLLDINKQKNIVSTEQMPEGFFDYFKSPDLDINDKEEKEFLHSTISSCVNELTDKQKEIIFLRFEREISYEEIATILNISVESCYKSIYRSIKTIRISAEKMLIKGGRLVYGFSTDQLIKLKAKSSGN
jgi:RNA polymerase sigma factor (sigma-70 family)